MGVVVARTVLLLLGVAGLGVAVTVAPHDRSVPYVNLPAVVADASPTPAHPNIDSLASLVVQRNVFRLQRSPSSMPYDPQRPDAEPTPPPPARPSLTVTGIIWAATPTALVEGFPGTTGARLVSPGDTVGGLRVTLITANEVLLVGMDTTWTLTMKGRGQGQGRGRTP